MSKVHAPSVTAFPMAAADLNGDGRMDWVVAGELSVRVFMNTCQ